MKALILLAFLAACSKGDGSAPDCDKTVDAFVGLATPTPTGGADKLDNLKGVLMARCTEDKWSAAARSCIVQATAKQARNECLYKHLTQQQNDSAMRATRPIFAESEARERADKAMTKFSYFKDEMCKCKDSACAQRVADDMTKWSQNEARFDKEPEKISEADTKRAAEIGEAMGKCMSEAMSAGVK